MKNFYVEKEKFGEFEKDLKKAVNREIEAINFLDVVLEKYSKKKFWKSKNDYFMIPEEAIVNLTTAIPILIQFKEGKVSQQEFYEFIDQYCKDEIIQIKLLEDVVGNRDFSICLQNENEEGPIRNQ